MSGSDHVRRLHFRARAVAAAAPAGISRYRESEFYSPLGDPYVLATLPDDVFPGSRDVPGRWESRLRALAVIALAEAVSSLPQHMRRPMQVLFAAPEPLSGVATPVGPKFLDGLSREADVPFLSRGPNPTQQRVVKLEFRESRF